MHNSTKALKNYVLHVYWGDEYPAIYAFQAVSIDTASQDPYLRQELSRYSAGVKLKLYEVPDNAKFAEYLKYLKEFDTYIKTRNSNFKKALTRLENKCKKQNITPICIDTESGEVLCIKTPENKN